MHSQTNISLHQVNIIITKPSIYGVIVYFLLCHESLNYCQVSIFYYYTSREFPIQNLQRRTTDILYHPLLQRG